MSDSFSESYRRAGVDVTAGYRAVDLIKKQAERTRIPGVLDGVGGFSGLFAPDLTGIRQPVLVSSTDGVGTKLKLAFLMDKHDTVGIDCVAMCVNDVICSGARPLFFLDYIALGKNVPERVEEIVKGVADGCAEAGCALIGGETAEMPGFYAAGEYDIAGFAVGIADRGSILDGASVVPSDVLIGLPSSGIHSNGFSLVRHIFRFNEENIHTQLSEFDKPLGELFLTPTKIYVKQVAALMASAPVKALAHITGGGFYENIPRMLPEGCHAHIECAAIPEQPIFALIQKTGNIPERDMYNTFNMGIGMVAAVGKVDADRALRALENAGEKAVVIGEVKPGERGVTLY